MEALATRPSARPPLALRSARVLRLASDERLVALTRAGVIVAYEAIYDRHHRPLLSFCRHMLGSPHEAEDAVQQTFLSAHCALLESDRPIHLRAWLYAIARNRCLSMLRARRDQPTADALDVATAGLAEQVQEREDLRELLGDLQALPDDQRAALVLAELGALSHEDIGEVLGVPRNRVKALVFQARESLIAARHARHADCREIRRQLATLTGGALRRAPLRRHLAVCEGCRAYKAEISRQRRALAILLPVVPSAALKHGALPAGAAGSGAAATSVLAGGTAAKLAAAAAVAATAAGGTVAVVDHHAAPAARAPAATHATPTATHRAAAVATVAPTATASRVVSTHGSVAAQHTPKAAARARRARHHSRPAAATGAAPTSPGRSASAPSRTGATPSRANPTPGVPARRQGPPPSKPAHMKHAPPVASRRPNTPPRHGPPATKPGRSATAPGHAKP
jgi:RNA polymerase sigma factor (sigma-70 family)